MKLAILGAGMIVQDFLSMAQALPEIKLKAIFGMENDLTHLENLQSKYQIKQIYTDYNECLNDKDIDTVYIGLPNNLHFEYTKRALLAGKNVICEKPFTISLTEAETLKKIALESNLVLLEAITNQYSKAYLAIKNSMSSIGDVCLIECNASHYSSRYEQFKSGLILPAFNPKMGGGALLDLNIYNIHFVVGIFGLPKKVNYIADVQKGIDVSGVLVLDYSDFKAVCISCKNSTNYTTSAVQGTHGSILISDGVNLVNRYTIQYRDDKKEENNCSNGEHRMFSEFQTFIEVIRAHDMFFVEKMLNHSVNVMRVVDLALKDAGITIG